MHYFQFNIGDYASHTRNLSILEDISYRRLLDEYYLHEQPLNGSPTDIARQIGMKDYVDEIKFVLMIYFTFVDGQGWVNARADKEIAAYHSKITQASKAGKASAKARMNKSSTGVQPNIKHKTLNINHIPIKNIYTPEGVDESLWNDFVILRKAKKLPITETAINGLIREGNKAGLSLDATLQLCCERGWAGFKAEWIADKPKAKGFESERDRGNRELAEQIWGKVKHESIIDIN
jgi:uncharacterized protein YdaU (DUF1376 family)